MGNVLKSHTQCKLQKGNVSQTTWLPSRYAEEGRYVKLRDRDSDTWDDGWRVIATYSTMETERVNERSQDYKRTRKKSDVARDGGREKIRVK